MASVYVIYSAKLDKYYVGATVNIPRRIYEHNIGHSPFTSRGIPWELVYEEQFVSLREAKFREQEIKRKKSRKYLVGLISGGHNEF
jgi:putative endonuclease